MVVPSQSAVRRYVLAIGSLGLVYGALVLFVTRWLLTREPDPWQYALAPIPALPIVLAWPAFTRFVRSMDEMHQKIVGEALQTTLGLTGVVTFAYGWLELTGAPAVSVLFVFPLMMALFCIQLCIGMWRVLR